MKTLKQDTKNNLYPYLFTVHGVTVDGKFPDNGSFSFFNEVYVESQGTDDFLNTYYGLNGYSNSLKPSFNIRKGILRHLAMKMLKNVAPELGYIAHDGVTHELWVGYYDGTCEEVNNIIKNGNRTNESNRMIHMYGKNDVIEKAYVDDNGLKKQYIIGSGKDENSAAAYMMYQALNLLLNEKDVLIQNGFDKLEYMINNSGDTDMLIDKAKQLTLLENDIYVQTCYKEGQSNYIPKDDIDFPDASKVIAGYLPNTLKSKKPKTIGDIATSAEFKVNHKFVGDDEKLVPTIYDHYLPDENTLTIANVLKNFSKLPEVPVMNILLTGEAGTGKSTAAQLLARLCNLPYRFITMSADTTVADLLLNILPGKKANTFEHYESEFVKAFRNGGIIEIQEVNTVRKPNVLTSLNAALDGLKELHLPNGEIIKRHENCVVVFTANIGYEGTAPMNQALMSRCCLKLEYTLPSDAELAKRLVEKSGVDISVATLMVKAMHNIQNILEEEGETLGICSFREITAWAQMTKVLNDPVLAGEITIVNSGSFDKEVKPRLLQAINNYFN